MLLSNLLEHAWRAGGTSTSATLIGEVQSPPLRKLGVFEIDAFFPPKERTGARAASSTALVASPVVRSLGRGRAARPGDAAAHPEGKPRARSSTSPTSPTRSASSSSRSCSRSSSRGCAAQSGTSDLRALVVHGRGLRLRPADRDAAGEEADPDHPQAGRAFGVGHGARDAEPGRPRLQGDGERGNVAGRPPADRATTRSACSKASVGGGRRRTSRARRRHRRSREARSSCWSARRARRPPVRVALGDVIPARAADE